MYCTGCALLIYKEKGPTKLLRFDIHKITSGAKLEF